MISNAANPFSRYFAEILRAEGLNEFTATDITNVTPAVLNAHDVAILGDGPLTAGQAQMLSDWVQAGGNLIASRPDPQLAGLLGLTSAGGTLDNGYLQVDTNSGPGAGIVGQTIQYHGTADRYTTNGAQTIATLYSDATTATANPAVTMQSVGSNGGHAAAFTYDLARSIVETRQGNPAWSGDERDSSVGGSQLIRSDDLFFGAKTGDVQPDWVDLNKVAIPQADEQQHLLTNLIEQMNLDRKPLPRFWFLPHDKKAAVVMTGDDHGNGGTVGRFQQYQADSPSGLLGRGLAVRARHLLRLPGHPDHRLPGRRLPEPGVRDRAARSDQLPELDRPGPARVLLLQPAGGLRRRLPEPECAGHQSHPLHRLERLGDPAEGGARERHPPRHQLLLLAAGPGSRTARGCSPARGCRCASPTSTAR